MEMFLKGHYWRKGLISPLEENIQLGEQNIFFSFDLTHLEPHKQDFFILVPLQDLECSVDLCHF